MTIRLRLGDDSFDIPVVGDANWGEQITLYLKKNSEIIATIFGPQDILLTTAQLNNGAVNEPINGLVFDTTQVQQVIVEGLITRKIVGENPRVDSFVCNGVYDNSNFYIDYVTRGTDAGVELDVNSAGQFIYTAEDIAQTSLLSIKFRAKAIIKEEGEE